MVESVTEVQNGSRGGEIKAKVLLEENSTHEMATKRLKTLGKGQIPGSKCMKIRAGMA